MFGSSIRSLHVVLSDINCTECLWGSFISLNMYFTLKNNRHDYTILLSCDCLSPSKHACRSSGCMHKVTVRMCHQNRHGLVNYWCISNSTCWRRQNLLKSSSWRHVGPRQQFATPVLMPFMDNRANNADALILLRLTLVLKKNRS
jgi:hypothetical protein